MSDFHHLSVLLVLDLLASAVVTVLLAHWVDTRVIVGFMQEGKAEKALEVLRAGLLCNDAVHGSDTV